MSAFASHFAGLQLGKSKMLQRGMLRYREERTCLYHVLGVRSDRDNRIICSWVVQHKDKENINDYEQPLCFFVGRCIYIYHMLEYSVDLTSTVSQLITYTTNILPPFQIIRHPKNFEKSN